MQQDDRCEYIEDCRKERIDSATFRAVTSTKIEQMEVHAKDIRSSVDRMEQLVGGLGKDVYTKLGQLTEALHIETQNRMTADSKIEVAAAQDASGVKSSLTRKIDANLGVIEKDLKEGLEGKVSTVTFGLIITVITALLGVLSFIFSYAGGKPTP